MDFPGLNQCVISQSLMERCGLNEGDTVTVYDDAMQRMELTISGVFDNYIYNYLIVHADSVTAQWGEAPEWNAALVNCAEGVDPHSLSATASGLDGVSNVSVNRDTQERFDNMMSSLNYIVIMVVVCAAAQSSPGAPSCTWGRGSFSPTPSVMLVWDRVMQEGAGFTVTAHCAVQPL